MRAIRFEEFWLSKLGGSIVDFAKMDIEGHELNAIYGFGKAIHFTKLFQFEFGGGNIDTKTYFQDFFYFFKTNGFAIYRMTPLGLNLINSYSERDEVFATTNYLAVNLRLNK